MASTLCVNTVYKEWAKKSNTTILLLLLLLLLLLCSYMVEGSQQLHVSAIVAIIRLYIAWERSWIQYATTNQKPQKPKKLKTKEQKTKQKTMMSRSQASLQYICVYNIR